MGEELSAYSLLFLLDRLADLSLGTRPYGLMASGTQVVVLEDAGGRGCRDGALSMASGPQKLAECDVPYRLAGVGGRLLVQPLAS